MIHKFEMREASYRTSAIEILSIWAQFQVGSIGIFLQLDTEDIQILRVRSRVNPKNLPPQRSSSCRTIVTPLSGRTTGYKGDKLVIA
jgi:hypothetical protein